VDRLKAGATDFDLVLMDVQMPEMDGFEATRLIRSQLGLALPVLALTAGVRDADRERCLESGMNDFIAKPFDLEQMIAVILRHAEAAEASPASSAVDPVSLPSQDLAAFDHRQGMLRIGDEGKLIQLLTLLLDDNQTLVSDLHGLLDRGERDEAARRLHALRGAAANVAAIRLATRATEAEAAILEGRDSQARALLSEIAIAFLELSAIPELAAVG